MKITIIIIVIALFLGNFGNFTIANEEETPTVCENSFSILNKETRIAEPTCDKIRDKIADTPESLLPVISENKTMMDVIIAYDHAPTISDVSTIEKFGGIVYETWDNVVYAAHAEIPVENISKYSLERGIILIEENAEIHTCLDFSVKQIRVRPTVWNTYGYSGDSNHAIAILDTGIDDSHPDLSGKIVKWKDFTNDSYPNPIDKLEHGTHCSGIAVGKGTKSGSSTKKYTWSDFFGWDGDFLTEYAVATKSGTLSLKLDWDDDFGDGRGNAYIWIDKNQNEEIDSGEYTYGGGSPLTYSASVSPGRYMVGVAAYDLPAALEDFYCQINSPSQSLGDGHNLLKGVAPSCKLAGLKIFDDYGNCTHADLISALNWLSLNAQTNGIIVASMSIGGPSSTTVDTAVNNLVSSGVVCVAAAGNSQGLGYIGSPGTAAKALTIGAVNDEDYLTSYSSIGDPGKTPLKPDILAPGGSYYTGDKIISVDSNDADLTWEIDPDRYSDDYRAMLGTSMACPHVSGLAALVADAMGTWQYNEEWALKVKQIILMTAYEVGSAENPSYTPPFNFGGKDNKEGYGRVCADAAVEAATMEINLGVSYIFSFGNNVWNKKVWTRQISLEKGTIYNFSMDVPVTEDYDLYLYDKDPDGNGEPVLLNYSCGGVGSDEFIQYSCGENGTYYIAAKWYSGSGQAEIICQELNDPPMANFTYSPSDPSTQDEIQFTDTSIDPDGTIISWSWDFGDGNTSTIQHPTHQYADNGTYTVTLNVTDDDGTTNETYLGITVANVPPVVNFTYAPENPTTNDTIIFTDTSTDADGTIISWLWGFGDNTTSLEQNPIHQYADNGTYTVTLNVTDDDGDTNETSQHIVVSNIAPTADFSWSLTNSTTDDIIQFTDISTDSDGFIVSWFWDFDDGNTSTEQHPTHQYAEGNTYNVTLNVTDDDGITDEISQQIIVNVIPIASFSYTPSNPYTSDIISFTDQSIDTYGPITSWLWDFGDEFNSTEQNPTYQYSDNGTYTVTLNVTDEYGATNETSQQIVVSNVGPIANFSYLPLFPTDLQIITFTDNSIDSDGYIISWSWDFGDGESSAEQNPSHTFQSSGTYTVTLTVKDDSAEVGTDTIKITVSEGPSNQSPTCSLSATPTSGDAPFTVTFSMNANDEDGSISFWELDVDNDGSAEYSDSGFPPSGKQHIYQNSGTYTAKLTVIDNGSATNYDTITITVNVPPPEPITLSGSGDDVTSSFDLNEGIATFQMTHNGGSNFIIWLYNADTGEKDELLVNEIGSYSGSRIVGVYAGSSDVKPGRYLLDVTAGGSWEVNIEQPTPSTAPSLPQTFIGSGADVPSPFMLESGKGAVKFTMHHTGSSNFIIWIYHASGDKEELLVNEIGNYDGSTLVSVGGWSGASPGIHYISVEADGSWDVSISYV